MKIAQSSRNLYNIDSIVVGVFLSFLSKRFFMNLGYFVAALQIITESLPISSSTHRKIFFDDYGNRYFDFLLHLPTCFITALYLIRHVNISKYSYAEKLHIIISIVVSTVITVCMYPLMKVCAPYFPLWAGLLVTTLLLLSPLLGRAQAVAKVMARTQDKLYSLISSTHVERSRNMQLIKYDAIILGIAQGVALLPGISRLTITIVIGQWCGMSASGAFYYALALELPLFGGASFFALQHYIYEYLQVGQFPAWSWAGILLIASSCIIAYGGTMVVHRATVTHKLWYFGLYTGILMLIMLFCCLVYS